jgi:hypothetical protein
MQDELHNGKSEPLPETGNQSIGIIKNVAVGFPLVL